jgi:DNA polymerase II small subunit
MISPTMEKTETPNQHTEKEKILEYAQKKGVMLNFAALDKLQNQNFEIILDSLVNENQFLIDEILAERKISQFSKEAEKEKFSTTQESIPSKPKPLSKEFSSNYKILHHLNYSGESKSKGKMNDFLELFQDKYNFLFGELKNRGFRPKSLGKIDRVGRDDDFELVVMISDKFITKNGHVLLSIEDLEGEGKALIPASDEKLIKKAKRLTVDDVIGLKCKRARTGELIIVNDFAWPNLPQRKPKTSEVDLGLLITSDIHIGSKLFLRDWFEKFVQWTNGKIGTEREREKVGKLKYMIIAGDTVDGVGVFPNHLEELEVKDIYEQYRQLENYLLELPEQMEIFITPGNHDPCRWHDPQPAIVKEYLPKLHGMKNIHFLPSPAWVEIEGQKTLIYHGSGLIGAMGAMNIPPTKPEEAIKELLIKRDLMSVYGTKHPYAPEPKAYMLVRELPDIYVGGDNHYNAYAQYRGTTIVNNGCWQLTSAYAASKGFINTPGRVPQFFFKDASLRESRFDKEKSPNLVAGEVHE